MNRCFHFAPIHGWPTAITATLLGLAITGVQAQTAPARIPPIESRAERGVLQITQAPEIRLDGAPARLAPGARIRAQNNLLVLPAALVGQELHIRYTRDPLGLVHQVWILSEAERQSP